MSEDPRPQGEKIADPGAALRLDLAQAQAIELRAKNMTYREIAEAMDVSVETAYRYVNKGWARINEDTDNARMVLRAVEDERLEMMLAASMPLATDSSIYVEGNGPGGTKVTEQAGDLMLKAQMVVLRISQRKAAMFGLNAPKEIKHTKGKSSLEPLSELRKRAAVTMKRRVGNVSGSTN